MTNKSKYKVKLVMADKVFKSEDEDLMKAINKIDLKPKEVYFKGIFTITKGNKKVEKLMFNYLLKRFLRSDLAKIVWVKTWKSILDNG